MRIRSLTLLGVLVPIIAMGHEIAFLPNLNRDNLEKIEDPKNIEEAKANERLSDLFSEAKVLVTKYEEVNGKDLSKKLEKKFKQEDSDERSYNQFINELLVRKFLDIKSKKKDNVEIGKELIYETCIVFLKYQESDLQLPLGIILVFKENPEAVKTMINVVKECFDKLAEIRR